MNALVIFTYPQVEKYLSALIRSINYQTVRNFSVIFINDGLINLEDYLRNDLIGSFTIIPVSGTPFENRIFGLKKVQKMGFENIIFQDADDLMSENRIEECLKNLKNASIILNDLDLIDDNGKILFKKFWSQRLDHGTLFGYGFIRRFNLLGFTNTSIRTELLNYLPLFHNEEIIAVDWYIFYQILHKSDHSVKFINSTTSQYRQHSKNSAGLGGLSKKRIQKALKVKIIHYKSLIKAGFNFEVELERLLKLESENKHKLNINNHLFWWEETEWLQ